MVRYLYTNFGQAQAAQSDICRQISDTFSRLSGPPGGLRSSSMADRRIACQALRLSVPCPFLQQPNIVNEGLPTAPVILVAALSCRRRPPLGLHALLISCAQGAAMGTRHRAIPLCAATGEYSRPRISCDVNARCLSGAGASGRSLLPIVRSPCQRLATYPRERFSSEAQGRRASTGSKVLAHLVLATSTGP
jgi:hypothetical protein